MFNYGQGYFDVGAGRWFNTRGQRSRWMEERGLRPIEDGADAFVERGGKKASKIKVDKAAVKDAYEQGQARLRQGWRPMKQQEANAIQKELSSG